MDHYNDFVEIDLLRNTSATAIINAMKKNFARLAIPQVCVSDNGPQFISHEYSQFASEYGFKSIKSSPCHSRSNGKVESAVKVAKNILKKARQEDPYLALLAYRNTPQQGHTYSPAERITGGCQKKSPLQKWLTWFIMTMNKENVNKSFVFVLT